MVKGKGSSGAEASQHLEHQASRSTDNSSTMSNSAKPKSSTSEAAKTQIKRRTIQRCSESDEEGIEDEINDSAKHKTTSESTKPKPSITKHQIAQEPIDSDHEDEEESEDDDEDEESEDDDEDDEDEGDDESSDDEQANIKKPIRTTTSLTKKQTSSKKQSRKWAVDSEDDEDIVEVANKSKKSKTQPSAPSSSGRRKTAVSSKHRNNNDSDDDIIEMPSKTTKAKPKPTHKQSAKSLDSTLTRKQMFKASKAPADENDPDEDEEDSSDEEAPNVTVTERRDDLFSAPANTLLLHACNCVGSWGAGIALAFKEHYPDHFEIYKAHCASKTPSALLSTCFLIPPQRTGPQHWIGCLFTSRKYGRAKDREDDIMDSTDSALQDMLEQLGEMKDRPKQIWMCKINSGSFKVPWSQTKALIEALTFKNGLHIQVVDKK